VAPRLLAARAFTMADPIWLDTCTISDIADSPALEAEIRALGAPLLMVPKSQEELLNGNPFKPNAQPRSAEEIARAKAVVQRLNIELDMRGSSADRVGDPDPDGRLGVIERQFKFKPKGPTVVRAIEESDAIVLSQISASASARGIARATLISTDGRLTRNADARLWNIDIRLPRTPPVGGGGSGGVGGLPPGTTTIQVGRTTPGAGAANAGAFIAVFQIVDTLANYLNNKYLQKEVNTQMSLVMAQVRTHQRENPADGALITIAFTRVRPNDASGVVKNTVAFHPGDAFESISVYFEFTIEKALERQQRPELRPEIGSDSHYKYERSQNLHWVKPVQPALESPVGTWRVNVNNRWNWLYAFSADGGVRWTDPFNKQTGKGKWKIEKDLMTFTWDPPSTTKESWDFPIDQAAATGRGVMAGEGYFKLTAVKQP
jgi:hypothetical protein